MKKIILILIVFAGYFTNAQSIDVLDKENGFRDLHFGDSISKYPMLTAFDQTPDSQFVFYRKPNDNYTFGGANVDIVYTFYKGELATVYMQTNDSISSRKVLKTLQNLYGKGHQLDPYIEKYTWNGRVILLSYMEDINKFDAKIYISSIKIKLKSEGRDKY